jgi:hypothetical protein
MSGAAGSSIPRLQVRESLKIAFNAILLFEGAPIRRMVTNELADQVMHAPAPSGPSASRFVIWTRGCPASEFAPPALTTECVFNPLKRGGSDTGDAKCGQGHNSAFESKVGQGTLHVV